MPEVLNRNNFLQWTETGNSFDFMNESAIMSVSVAGGVLMPNIHVMVNPQVQVAVNPHIHVGVIPRANTFVVFDSGFIKEPLTSSHSTILKNKVIRTKKSHAVNFEIFNWIVSQETDEIEDLDTENIMKLVANDLLSRIEELEKQGKKHQSIKEAHKSFETLLSQSSFEIANQVLRQSLNKNFSLAILIAFLASTQQFKKELTNRKLVFEKAERIATNEMGEERLGKSIFKNLK